MTLAGGVLLYALAAWADAALTLRGLGGDLALEGNPFLRATMARLGAGPGLFVEKLATGLVCVALAYFLEPEIKRRAAWIDKVPSTPWARAWMKRGERSWIAYVPLYGTAAFQLFGAASWAALRASRP